MAVAEITDATFEQDTNSGVVLTDFWATWCGPCRMQSPIVETVAEDMAGQVTVNKLDVDANQQTAAAFGVMSIPTLLIKKDGQVVDKLIGLHTKDQIEDTLKKYL